ncbi:MAG TPA: CoA-transferase, partial [Chloroflexia bacterium]|nr:CoA-transferase [Chloroflexia bacterium]
MSTSAEPGYTPAEMTIVAAARALAGARSVFVGVGLPNLVCNLARHTVAPDLELIYESGVYGARPARQPLSIGDPSLVSGATAVMAMADLFGLYLQGGRVDVALLGGAQIDRYGNLNT